MKVLRLCAALYLAILVPLASAQVTTIRQSLSSTKEQDAAEAGAEAAGAEADDYSPTFPASPPSSSSTSLDVSSQYQQSQKLLHPTASVRDFRRGLALLEEISKGRSGRVSADALADLAHVYLFGSHGKNVVTQQPIKAFQYANQSAHHGSPRGRHLLALMLRLGLGMNVPGGAHVEADAASWKMELLAAEQNYLPAMMAVAYRYLHHYHDCDAALRLYRAAAHSAVARVDATFYGDYASLRTLSSQQDELGDDLLARSARDAETIDYWLFHAERKEGRALFEIGKMYQLGLWGTHQNLQSSVEYYRRAAAAGHIGAQGELGRLLTIGHGCDLNLGFALKYLRQAVGASGSVGTTQPLADGDSSRPEGGEGGGSLEQAERVQSQVQSQEDYVAAATLGSLLKRRIFESEDGDMAVRYLRQAASAGSMDAEWELGQAELLDGRLDAALQHFQRAEKAGHVRSILALAQLYEGSGSTGSGVAKGWVHVGHAHGHIHGHGQGKDQASICKVVTKLYKRVAEVGPWLDSPYGPRQAMRELRAGRESEALLMYLLAAGEGYEIPHYNAAWMLIRNKGMSSGSATLSASAINKKYRRHGTALRFLQSLNEMNPSHPCASLLEGDLHYRGSGTPRNVSAAANCYERSAAAGNVLAMERLAVLLINGAGVRQDDQRAQQLIRHALTRVGQDNSGLKGFAVLVKQVELSYRLVLMSFTALVRAALSGRWVAGTVRYLAQRMHRPERQQQLHAGDGEQNAMANLVTHSPLPMPMPLPLPSPSTHDEDLEKVVGSGPNPKPLPLFGRLFAKSDKNERDREKRRRGAAAEAVEAEAT